MSDVRWGASIAGLAGVLGAVGVGLAAVAAHRVSDPTLATAAQFLMMHGAAALGLAALANGSDRPRGYLVAASLMVLSVTLFSGDLSFRVLAGEQLLPMIAPVGGSLLIVAWIIAGIAGLRAAIAAR